MLLLVVAAAGFAGEHVTVDTLAFAVDQELEGLKAADAQRVGQTVLRTQQLPLGPFFLDFGLQLTGRHVQRRSKVKGGRPWIPAILRCG